MSIVNSNNNFVCIGIVYTNKRTQKTKVLNIFYRRMPILTFSLFHITLLFFLYFHLRKKKIFFFSLHSVTVTDNFLYSLAVCSTYYSLPEENVQCGH